MLQKLDIWISKIERLIIGSLLIIMTTLIFVNVTLRFFTGETITWAEDLAIFLMICMTFFAAAYGTRFSGHITMSALYDAVSEKIRRSLYAASLILSAFISCFLFVMGIQVTQTIFGMKGEIASMGISKYLPYLFVSVALLFMSIHFMQLLIRFIRTRKVDDSLDREA